LHDIGRIAMSMLVPTDYPAAPGLSGESQKLETERDLFGVDHCQTGCHIALAWHFPEMLTDVIAHHHDAVSSATPRLRLLVQSACLAASMSGFHAVEPPIEWSPSRIEALLPLGQGSVRPRYEFLAETVAANVAETEHRLG